MKEQLIKEIAKKLELEERIVEKIVSHQFDSATNALKKHNSVELSGFGKFLFNEKKALKKLASRENIKSGYIKRLADDSLSEEKRKSTEVRLVSIEKEITILTQKLYGEN